MHLQLNPKTVKIMSTTNKRNRKKQGGPYLFSNFIFVYENGSDVLKCHIKSIKGIIRRKCENVRQNRLKT